MTKARPAATERVEQRRQVAVDVLQRGGVRCDRVLDGPFQVEAIRLMDGRDVQEQEHAAARRQGPQPLDGQRDLVLGRARVGHAQLGAPVALREQAGQDAPQRAQLVEEADPADADRMIPEPRQPRNDVGGVEDAGPLGGRLAAREADGERPRVLAGRDRRGQEAGEERVVGGVGEAGRRVPLLPRPAGQDGRQVGRPAGSDRVAGHVVPQRVDRHQEHVVRADQVADVDHEASSRSPSSHAATSAA